MANVADVNKEIQNKKNTTQKQVQTPAAPQPSTQFLALKSALSDVFPSIKNIVPKHMTPERLMRIVLTSSQHNPALAECTPQSVIGAVVNCATLGLEPNLLGHAYLIPYRNKKTGCTECQFQIGYKGLIDLIRRSGNVQSITAHVVYENDEFDYEYGLNEMLRHKPAKTNRGEAIFYYAVYKLRDGGYGFEVLSKEDAEAHRDKFSKAKTYGPWVDNFDAMALKTVVKQMVKWMPISIDIQQSLSTDSQTINIKENVSDAQEAIDVFDYSYVEETEEVA